MSGKDEGLNKCSFIAFKCLLTFPEGFHASGFVLSTHLLDDPDPVRRYHFPHIRDEKLRSVEVK